MQENRYISGEEYRAMQRSRPPQRKGSSPLWAAAALIIIGLAFFGAFEYLHNNTNTGSNSSLSSGNSGKSSGSGNLSGNGQAISPNGSGQPDCAGDSGACRRSTGGDQVIGTVTDAGGSSITILPDGASNTKTLSITGSTQETTAGSKNFSSYNASNIHVGEEVDIVLNGSDNSQARLIILNYQP